MYKTLLQEANASNATLIAVSKRKPNEAIMELYNQGHRDFGENYVQELVDKHEALPKDINWHFIGTLQRNKVKYIAPFVHLVHGVDSIKLMTEIDKRGQQNGRIIDVLMQVDVTDEETKHGFTPAQLIEVMEDDEIHRLAWARPSGIMGMASNTSDEEILSIEFGQLNELFLSIKKDYYDRRPDWNFLSMGMSSDYQLALKQGSNMLRVGSLLFGARE